MRFRTALFAGALALLLGVVGATLGTVAVVLDRAARSDAEEALGRARTVFDDQLALRLSLHRAEARVVAEEPRLKAVAATQDINPETVLGVARELRKAIGCELFVITDASGRVLADVAQADATGADMSGNELVARALKDGTASAVWTDGEGAYEVEGIRLGFGATVVGVLVLGHRIDHRLAALVQRETGAGVLIELDGRTLGASFAEGDPPLETIRAAVAGVPVSDRPTTVAVGGIPFQVLRQKVPGYRGKMALSYALVDSLEQALEPKRRVEWLLLVIGAVALLGALGFASVLSRRLSRPLGELVDLTRAVAADDLAQRARPGGLSETRALGEALNKMIEELGTSRKALVQKERLQNELEIASRIQTSILPRTITVDGLEIAARMVPADEVGGDYYDVQPVRDGCWIGVGDVAGHGLTAGLVMMMTQSAISALVRERPDALPGQLLKVLNQVIYENVVVRLGQREHMTLSLLRYYRGGGVKFAGAHEDILVCRGDGRTEWIETPGTWVGAIEDVGPFCNDYNLELHDGDVMVLQSDGLYQAQNAAGELYGLERVSSELERMRDRPVTEIRDHLIEEARRWAPSQRDDITVLVMRFSAPEGIALGKPRAR